MPVTNRRRVRLALAAALPLLLAPLTAGVADAATWTHRDARGDATRVEMDMNTGERTFSDAPDAAGVDVTRFTVRHLPRKVVLTTDVRDLPAKGAASVLGRVATPRGGYLVMATRGEGLYMQMLMQMRGRTQLACTGLTSDFDAVADVVRLEIPRACLDRPAWVRAGAALDDEDILGSIGSDGPDEDTRSSASDDALRNGGKVTFPKLGPKVRVG